MKEGPPLCVTPQGGSLGQPCAHARVDPERAPVQWHCGMALKGVALMRVQKELKLLFEDPPPGISAWACDDSMNKLEAVVHGAEGTPYANGRFHLQICIPARYPFEPPKVQFVTPIYHPNIDSAGRICLDTLNLPPKGAWKPSLSISTVLSSLQLLMSEPNPDDGLMVDITAQFVNDHARYERTAVEHTRRYASGADAGVSGQTEAANGGAEAAQAVAASADAAAPADAAPTQAPSMAAAPETSAPATRVEEPLAAEADRQAAKRQRHEE